MVDFLRTPEYDLGWLMVFSLALLVAGISFFVRLAYNERYPYWQISSLLLFSYIIFSAFYPPPSVLYALNNAAVPVSEAVRLFLAGGAAMGAAVSVYLGGRNHGRRP